MELGTIEMEPEAAKRAYLAYRSEKRYAEDAFLGKMYRQLSLGHRLLLPALPLPGDGGGVRVTHWTEGLIESSSRCNYDHPIWLITEGYGICRELGDFWVWRMTPSAVPGRRRWRKDQIWGRDGQLIEAWVSGNFQSKAKALAYIQQDMEAHRVLLFDEGRELARLMPV